ncbi:hypothetical protein [Sulfurimonas sp.]|nr:hypothetical protein [Sulfurimonas sp.]
MKFVLVLLLFCSSITYAVDESNRELEHSVRDSIGKVTQPEQKDV